MNLLNALVPSLLMIVGGIITWLLKSRVEELRAAEENLRETRTKAYWDILEPYFLLFSDTSKKNMEIVLEKITSPQYRKASFRLCLLGSDDVVQAYNTMWQHTYKAEQTGNQDSKELIRLWGALLIEIRKSLGNKKTKLKEVDMLRGLIKDIDDFL
ncbi:MAG: hypothetical protein KAR47_21555 [Planctomycetes bacterium]|nr:hypothetical protein [Planctomycetota bacterium]